LGKFGQVTKKVPAPRTSNILAFDEKSTFDCFALFGVINQGSPNHPKESKKIKGRFFIEI
jgi:hypothetical protein